MRFSGQTAAVTGAASGIGRGIAAALVENGADVLLVDRSPRVHAVAEELGAAAIETDVTDRGFPDEVLEWLDGRGLSHLVTAAGIQVRTPAISIAEDEWQRLVDVNLSSFYRTIRGLHGALSIGDGVRPGSVVAMSSMSAERVLTGIVPYGAVKAGLSQLVAGLAVELAEEGIRLNALAPGYILTELTRPVLTDPSNRERIVGRTPMGRLGDPADVTGPALFLLSPDSGFITGHTLPVDGGYALA